MYNISIKSTNRKFTQQEAETIMNEICSQTTFSLNGSFVYENNKTRIPLKCDVCGNEWSPTFDSIKSGKGCSKCSYKKNASSFRRKQEDVEKDLNNILQGKYTYKPFVYENKNQSITLYCQKHNHEWINKIENILKGQKCKFCAKEELYGETLKNEVKSKERRDFRNSIPINENLVRFNMMGYNIKDKRFKGLINTLKLDFVLKAKDYSLLKPYWYTTKDVRISLKCNKDGHEWATSLGEIIRGAGCIKCAKIKTSELNLKPKEEVLKQLDEVSKGRYSYDRDFEYKGVVNSDYISCKCLVCDDEFETSLISLLQGHGCRKCANKTIGDKNRLDKEEVLERLKNSSEGRYIWEDFDYCGTLQKIKLQCLRNGSHTWETSISNLIYGDKSGCPHCNPKYSKIETKIREYVESIVEPYGLEVEANNRSIIPSLKDPRFFMENIKSKRNPR